jgi:hypothetical protein
MVRAGSRKQSSMPDANSAAQFRRQAARLWLIAVAVLFFRCCLSIFCGFRGTPPQAIVYAVSEFIWGMPLNSAGAEA